MIRLLTFLLLCMSFTLSAQEAKTYQQNTYDEISMPMTGVRSFDPIFDWRLSNDSCNGCTSFYWTVVRSTNSHYSKVTNTYVYEYFLVLSSNSMYANGELAPMYIGGLFLVADGTMVSKRPSSATLEADYVYFHPTLSVISEFPAIKFKLKYGELKTL